MEVVGAEKRVEAFEEGAKDRRKRAREREQYWSRKKKTSWISKGLAEARACMPLGVISPNLSGLGFTEVWALSHHPKIAPRGKLYGRQWV